MDGIVYNTPFNTVGVGDPVPFGMAECGSGDLFGWGPAKSGKSTKGKKRNYIGMATKPAAPQFSNYGYKAKPMFVKFKRTKK